MVLLIGVALYHIVISDGTVTNSVKLDNNSVIAFNDIDGLACSSASSEKVGRWQYPDGTAAMGQVQGNRGPFYVIQRGSGRIDLFRQSNLGGRYEGIYTCFIPDESGVAQTLYAGIYARPGKYVRTSMRREGEDIIRERRGEKGGLSILDLIPLLGAKCHYLALQIAPFAVSLAHCVIIRIHKIKFYYSPPL